ncbi:alpha-1,4-N-acetylglucosaminyltransferase-like isoform X2 [Leucoraja erinacea]|nr:alpha-1,4-N-acetylglucosaminyltransferase-like isoform X2 [Leucoraja erinacea]XP_055502016.1 alpha-1,4-N-acetylglucosaminyltransferase-like isoform X2 [Leucoraja erinacea]XP_055502017.1 alpha-1,4-N-acetylglucosaminyltransferase-like isoform X2 [Leucoraja erinacea]XP_055502018.1 alpha-1,4-N-acetylglucosaminyltransferase-like isoform X2 [Leucoraja erinacea]XP_055502019.1 alpha-1,4-N-acetylglucosaminyltransferase-like isoform X2 [Leucoraja erinacea]XP_055502020.1 alpha-1,4-N-acetylglucosaminyl
MIPIHNIFIVGFIMGASVLLYVSWHLKLQQNVQKNMVRMSQVEDEATLDDPRPFLNPGIIFLETSDNVELKPLVMCSVESTARQNPDKPIYFFMKGFSGNLSQYPEPKYRLIPLLSSMKNVVLLPLNATKLFEDTPLKFWYQKVIPKKERFWLHVLADGCRVAMLWKYGGIYLDSDIISMQSLPFGNFTSAQLSDSISNGAMGFYHRHHPFLWNCMKDFVANYNAYIWGQQGPKLITRVLKRWCQMDKIIAFIGKECNGISLWNIERFYAIPCPAWEKYYAPWKKDEERIFSTSYGAHVWSFMNSNKKKNVIVGSGSLIEHFFQLYCPTTYRYIIELNNNSAI